MPYKNVHLHTTDAEPLVTQNTQLPTPWWAVDSQRHAAQPFEMR